MPGGDGAVDANQRDDHGRVTARTATRNQHESLGAFLGQIELPTLWVRLHEKGGKHHEMPCQHNLKDWLRAYIEAAGIADEKDGPSSAPWTATPGRSA